MAGEIYCLKCHQKTPNAHEHMVTTANGRHMIKATCAHCGTTKNQFVSAHHAGSGMHHHHHHHHR
jgi:RNase P subunit RPR2